MDYTTFGELHLNQAIGDFFVRNHRLSPTELARAVAHQEMLGGRLDTVLLDLGLLPEHVLLQGLGVLNRSPVATAVDLELIRPEVARIIAPRMAVRYKIVPFQLDGKKLSIAALARVDVLMEDELRLLTGCFITSHVALEVRLFEALANHYGVERTPLLRNLCRRLRTPPGRPAAPAPTPAPAPPVSRPSPAPPSVPLRPAPSRPVELDSIELTDEEMTSLSLAPDPDAAVGSVLDSFLGELPDPVTPDMSGAGQAVGPAGALLPPTVELLPRPEVAALPPTAAMATAPPVDRERRLRPKTPDDLLAEAAEGLKNAEMREEIGDAILGCSSHFFRRSLLLVRRGETIVGWRGEGEGVDRLAVRAISIPIAEPSVFIGLGESVSFWLGPLPPMPRNIDIVFGLGSVQPKECVILPVVVRERPVCFLYCDNYDQALGAVPMALLRRLTVKAGIAFQVYILKNKIHIA